MKLFSKNLGFALATGAALVLTGMPGDLRTKAFAQEESESAQQEDQGITLQELLRRVRAKEDRETREMREREARFRRERAERQRMLQEEEAEEERQKQIAERLEAESVENEAELARLNDLLKETLGDAGELFGVVRQVAGDAKGQIEKSLVSAQLPNRDDQLEVLTRGRVLPTIDQLRSLWTTLMEEMIEQGKVQTFVAEYENTDGERVEGEVIRIGPFTAIVKDTAEFLKYDDATDTLRVLPRQPGFRFIDAARSLSNAAPREITPAAIDPAQGAILDLLVRTPNLTERIDQAGIIGYIIIGLGLFGVVLAIYRFLSLTVIGLKVRGQARSATPSSGNPLGRIMMAYEDNKAVGVETLELKLDDAILKELPRLEWGLSTVKVLAAVAPLLGLLGTVTGMIIVFQQITLFGTGDPRLMAGGISQALMTTVLGLCAAIPLLILHSFASGQSRSVSQILEEQSAGLVAKHAEGRG